ncbi:MAG: (2Fe-2S)-binding protein [Deltaproteobacteria bacterium]|nr:(2Fe-2S)-binding protein [Deltaproteobacteria bacterium]
MSSATKTAIEFVLNDAPVTALCGPTTTLLDLLREQLDHKGTKEGCGKGECGACTVLVDGRAFNACLFPSLEVEGRQVTTIEGLLGKGGKLSVLQQAFVDQGGIQCGFCSPGMILSAHALLCANPDPTADEIRAALRGNLCRCTGYVQIVDSVKHAAAKLGGPSTEGGHQA